MNRPKRLAPLVVASLALAGGCSAGRHSTTAETVAAQAPAIPTPMTTSLPTVAGTWVTLPMGRLDEALNTFWQLFYRPSGPSSAWSNQVEATATATNGGLVLARGPNGELVVGVRPSSYLTFTPIIYTTNAAKTWSTGLLDAALAATPDALAVGPRGQGLALVGSGNDISVMEATSGLSTWRTLTGGSAVAASPAGQACGLGAITAVGYLDDQPLVAGSCGHPGRVGLLTLDDDTWVNAGPTLPSSLDTGRAEVLGLQSDGVDGDLTALIGIQPAGDAQPGTTDLVTAWRDSTTWTVSTPLDLPAGADIQSYGPDAAGGEYVLSGGLLHDAEGSSYGWVMLPTPPTGTDTVAFAAGHGGSSVEALTGSATVLTVWSLDQSSQQWSKQQTIDVPIQYGSSGQ